MVNEVTFAGFRRAISHLDPRMS